jgi:hypothetical protein
LIPIIVFIIAIKIHRIHPSPPDPPALCITLFLHSRRFYPRAFLIPSSSETSFCASAIRKLFTFSSAVPKVMKHENTINEEILGNSEAFLFVDIFLLSILPCQDFCRHSKAFSTDSDSDSDFSEIQNQVKESEFEDGSPVCTTS